MAVLVVLAVVISVAGVAANPSDSNGTTGGETVPFSVLPLAPEDLGGSTVTTATSSTGVTGAEPSTTTSGVAALAGMATTTAATVEIGGGLIAYELR